MGYDLEYFTEFLENPSEPDIADFYAMVRKWTEYIREHQDEFNYLEDDEWKEIRERLIEEWQKREVVREAINAEWEKLNEEDDNSDNLSDEEVIDYMRRRLDFMKAHQKFYDFKDEDIIQLEESFSNFVESVKVAQIAEVQARLAKVALDKSIANLDDGLVKYYERTGKIPVLPVYPEKKVRKGN